MGQTCPKCDEWFELTRNACSPPPEYCPFCGQEIEWESWIWDEEEERRTL
jgi:hypothetical protein